MKKLLLLATLATILISPNLAVGQCTCDPSWAVGSGAGNVASNNGGICVNDTWTGFITDNLSGANICVTDVGKWQPINASLPIGGFIGDFDLGINDGGLVEIIDGNPIISIGGKLINYGGSFITNTTGTLTFLDSVINNVGLLNNGLIDINSGSLLTQNILNSGLINISSDAIEILGASNIGTITIDQDEIDLTILREDREGDDYLVSPVDIGILNNFGIVRLLGERIIEVGLDDVWNNSGSDALLGLDVLGDAGIFLNGGTLNNIGGAKVLAGYLQNAYGHLVNGSGSIIDVETDLFNNGDFLNDGYIHVGLDLQLGAPGISLLDPFVNNNHILVDGDIFIKGKTKNEGTISTELGILEEGYLEESFLGGILGTVFDLIGADYLFGAGAIWLGTEPANIFDLTQAVTTGAGLGLVNNTLVVGTDPEDGLAIGVFPVKLVSLTGKQLKSRINVSWEASDYENFDSFILERSSNAKSFEGIARIEKKESALYNYDDFDPREGINYYRLKLSDTNGKYTYSKTIAVNYEVDGDYFTFENPVRDHTIHIRTNIKDSKLRLIDITGRNIPFDIYETIDGFEVKPQRVSQGVLFVSMAGERQMFTKKALMR